MQQSHPSVWPDDSKKKSSHACWFWVLEMVMLFKLLIIYTAKSIVIYSRVKRIIKAYLWQKRFVLILWQRCNRNSHGKEAKIVEVYRKSFMTLNEKREAFGLLMLQMMMNWIKNFIYNISVVILINIKYLYCIIT